MKKTYTLFTAIVLVAFCSCETSEETFFDFYQVYSSLPAASQEIASPYKSQEFHAYINERYEIYGTGNAYRFYSSDLMTTVQKERGFGKFGDYNVDGKNVISVYEDEDEVVIGESTNYGFDFTPKVIFPDVDYDYLTTFFLNPSTGWLVNPFIQFANVYQIKDNVYTKIAAIDTDMYCSVLSVYFKNELEGYLLIGETNSVTIYLYKTSDGGKTWGSPSEFELQRDSGNTRYQVNMVRAFGDLVVAYPDEQGRNAYYNHLYLSRDGGANWEFIHSDLACYQFITEDTGYALEMKRYVYNWEDDYPASTSYLVKTTDGGKTWNRVSDQVLYADNIYFTNENVGIATSYSMMQVTGDGGLTWHLLVYPLEEGS